MALVCATQSSLNFVGKTANLLNSNAAYTTMCWAQLSDVTVGNTNYGPTVDANDNSRYDTQEWLDTGGVLNLALGVQLVIASEHQVVGATALARNTWYHVAVVRPDTTNCLLYLNGVLEVTNTTADVTGTTAVGQQNIIHYAGGLTVGAYKAWAAALTATEILQEMQTLRPQRFANLNAWCPTFPGSGENIRDYSGTQDFTIHGTIADGNNPPVSYGAPVLASTTPVTIQLVLPASDGSVGSWTGEGGETTNLYTHINENPAVDSTYVQSGLGSAAFDTLTGRLPAFTIPTRTTGWALLVRDDRTPSTGTAVTLRVSLYLSNGTTLVHTEDVVLGGTVVLTTITLTPTEAALVTQGEATAGLVYKLLPVAA